MMYYHWYLEIVFLEFTFMTILKVELLYRRKDICRSSFMWVSAGLLERR